jgi:hypothetical protein
MIRLTAAVFTVVVLAAFVAAVAPSAQAYDRKTATLGGLYPHGWGLPINRAEQFGRSKFPGAEYVYCGGIFMRGYRAESSWIIGMTRYWDKLSCIAQLKYDWVGFIVDAKGRGHTTYYSVNHYSN